MTIVDLATAVQHLNTEMDVHGEEVSTLLTRIESLVLDHLEREAYTDEDPPPANVQQAVLLALTEAFDNRSADPLSPAVISLLRRSRSVGVF